MAKVDPFTFARPKPNVKEFTFVDPRYKDRPVVITFRNPDVIDYNLVQDKAIAFLREKEELPLPIIEGRYIEVGPALAQTVANLYVLQEMPDEEKYTMDEFAIMAVTMPTVFQEMGSAIADLTVEGELGKLIGVRLSLEPLPNTPEDTPNLTLESTDS